MYKTRRIKLKH